MDPILRTSGAAAGAAAAAGPASSRLEEAVHNFGENILKHLPWSDAARLKVASPGMNNAVIQRQSEPSTLRRLMKEAQRDPAFDPVRAIGRSAIQSMFMNFLLAEPFNLEDMGLLIGLLVKDKINDPDAFIDVFAFLAQAIHRSPNRPSPAQMQRFLDCLIRLTPENLSPWKGYCILQQFIPVQPELVTQFIQNFLRTKAEQYINPRRHQHENYTDFEYGSCMIDPRTWFGFHSCRHSFLNQPSPPPLVQEAIVNRARELARERPLVIDIHERAEALMDPAFAALLIEELVNNHIFVAIDYSWDNPNPFYSLRGLQTLGEAELRQVQSQYPRR